MSDDDFMCEDEEDYGLVSAIINIDRQVHFYAMSAFSIVFMKKSSAGILRGFQLGARRRSREPVLQQQGVEGGDAEGCAVVVSEGSGSREQREGRVGLQGTQADDKDQFQAGELVLCSWCCGML